MALILLSAVLVSISVSANRADAALTPAPSIVLHLGPDGNFFEYGDTQQALEPGCKLTPASVSGPIMAVTATSVDNKGHTIDPSPIGLISDGLGTSPKGNGNGQDCGLVDAGEVLTFTLGDVGSRLIQSMSIDLEGKYGGGALVTYLRNGDPIGVDHLALSENGSDSGPDARSGDDYYFPVLPMPEADGGDAENEGILFDAVRIQPDPTLADPGSVSVKSGADFPVPADNQTVFKLVPALDCGDTLVNGGPNEADNPLAAFYVGPTKGDPPCGVPVELTTANTTGSGGQQTVTLVPPDGTSWDGLGVSGLLTVVWDVESQDDLPIDRTLQLVNSIPVVIPWCVDVIGIAPSGNGWSYMLDPDVRYDTATGGGDLCLVNQSTENVFYDDGDPSTLNIWTQTTEVFYVWNDPILVRN